ncbi:pentatricopeptide repeat-containing protein At5g39680 [Asparagus officinalis]|uniref:pentatricopeptide repeat-containing protein At5g39680 n=1 Tax=Asparagus officinalis TaxID=4686 RepID=UPI00098E0729|nr:pentatricopeptide repeat-containing protein At5g39680 [Asparagus officinalis]
MPERNVVSFSALMTGYLHSGLASDALYMFKSMAFGHSSLRSNEYIFSIVLTACSDLEALCEGQQCHAYVVKSGLISHSYIRNTLLHMYSICSSVEDAIQVYKTLPDFDIFSFNSMIKAFSDDGYLDAAAEIMRSVMNEVDKWDQVTYVVVLGLSANLKDLRLGRQLHSQILRRGLENDVFGGSALVDMYGKCKAVLSARYAFFRIPNRNVVSWTALIAICTQNDCFEEALKLFLKMVSDGIQPNDFTFAVTLNSCAGLSTLTNGDALNAFAQKSGHKEYLNVGNALINMYSKCGSIEDAHKVFSMMLERDSVSWSSIITGYSHHGLGEEALGVFGSMLNEGMDPTYVTFVGVLSACGHLGLVHEGFNYLNSMSKWGISPGLEHHTCIIVILCRAGRLDEAEKHIRYTHIEWDIVAWRSLLNGCLVHRNFGLGKKVARHILQLDPNDVGTYILLSNIYAKESRWYGVVEVRKLMRERFIKKEPGVSWIQVRNETHVFASEDNQHPLIVEIRQKLADLMYRIKLIGYKPDIASVLHDVEDEQKEEYLWYHSEKLAVAFGFISAPHGATIHVIKNLRVCNDCHMALKLISTVTKRKMIVRDANRFHCFEKGVCSCRDYW